MGTWSIWHWLVVLIIVMLVFGTKKLRNIGQDLGGAIKGFKEGIKEDNELATGEQNKKAAEQLKGQTIDVSVEKDNSTHKIS